MGRFEAGVLVGLLAAASGMAACGENVAAFGPSGSDGGAPDASSADAGSGSDSGSGSDAGSGSDSGSGSDAASGSDSGSRADSGSDAGPGADGGGALSFVTGTNLSGAEFGDSNLPGTFGTDYTYPPHSDIDYFASKGFSVVRIPFLWERMQPALGQPLDAAELGRLTDLVSYATSKGLYALIDPHNYAQYQGKVVGSGNGAASSADYADFWSRLAAVFANDARVVFGLMNEPHDMQTELWLSDANAAIAAIRAANAANVIFVPGNAWTGAWTWTDNTYGTPNATVMLGVKDPMQNFVIEVHQYLDSDGSGTHDACDSATVGSERLAAFTQWLTANHLRGFLGEFAGGNNATCLAALDDMLTYVDAHRDVWAGWTWWSAGPWWGTYMFSLEPDGSTDAFALPTLKKHQ